MGKKGYQATRKLRERDQDKRGGNAANDLPAGVPGSLSLVRFRSVSVF